MAQNCRVEEDAVSKRDRHEGIRPRRGSRSGMIEWICIPAFLAGGGCPGVAEAKRRSRVGFPASSCQGAERFELCSLSLETPINGHSQRHLMWTTECMPQMCSLLSVGRSDLLNVAAPALLSLKATPSASPTPEPPHSAIHSLPPPVPSRSTLLNNSSQHEVTLFRLVHPGSIRLDRSILGHGHE